MNKFIAKATIFIKTKFGTKRDANGEWEVLHNEELHSSYCLLNIVRVIKSRILRWAGHVARMEEGRSAFKILTGTPAGKSPLRRPRCRWGTTLEWILKKWVSIREIGLIRLRIGIIGEPL